MKSKIYDYCNSLDAHAENYEDLPLTQAEHDRLKARVLGERTPRRHPSRWQKGLALAALVTLVAGLGAINGTTQKLYATAQTALSDVSYSINAALGREGDFAPYTDVVGTVLPLEDVNIKLNAVVLEEDRLTLSFLVEMPEDEIFTHMSLDEVRMNGRKLSVDGGIGSGGDISGHEGLYFMTETLFLNKDMPMDGQIDLTCKIRDVYSAPAEAYKSGEPVEETIRRGTVDFSFTASGENLKAASKVVAQNMPLPMLDGSEAVVQKVTLNPFAQRMTLSLPVTEDFMAYEMRGLDNHGNPIIFTATYIRQEGDQNLVDLVYAEPIADDFGTYGSSISGSDFFETARAMTLGLYGAKMTSGKEPAMEALSEDIQVTWS